MIEKINNNQISDILKDSSSKQTRETTGPASDSLQVDYESLIEKAAQLPENDADAVQRAQQLLQSGRLDSQQNIRAAAKKIVEFGI
jgi:putative cell wall-binding protein